MMNNRKKVLLAFGEGALVEAVFKAFQKAGFQVSSWTEKGKKLPKEHYDYLVQLGKDPTALSEGTRLLLEKAKREKAEFILVSSLKVTSRVGATKEVLYLESLRFAETLTKQFHQKYGLKTAILRLPTIFGPEIPLAESGTLGHLILEFTGESPKGGAALTIYGEGKDRDYYLYLTDAAEAVKMATAVANKEGEVFFATASTPLSTATIAEMLVEMGGGRHEIRYHKGLVEGGREVQLEGEALSGFKPQVSLKEGILQTLKALPAGSGASAKQKKWRSIIKVPVHLHLPRLRPPSQRRIIQLGIVLLVFSPFLYLGGRVALVSYHLLQLRQQLNTFNFQEAGWSAKSAAKELSSLNHFFENIPLLSQKPPFRDLQLISQGGEEILVALKGVLIEGETTLTIVENLVKSRQGEVGRKQDEEEFNRLRLALKETETQLLTAWLHLRTVQPWLQHFFTPTLDRLQEGLLATRLGTAFVKQAVDLLGYQGERNYLILFQNSAEARAGGGFLGSLAQLTVEDGGIKKLQFFDSYQFDQVEEKADIPAPSALKKFRGVEKLPLREGNFYASFPESGKHITQIFAEAQKITVDGVIGTNLLFAQSLLKIVGPLQLVEFDKTVTAENLFEVTTEEVEKEFFPGSTKKKRFLQALGEGLLTNLFSLKRESYTSLAKIVWEGLKQKDLLLYLEKGALAQALVESGFDGRLKAENGDFLMLLDTNFGTKTNLTLIKRMINYKLSNPTRADDLEVELTVTWEHKGTTAWPSGTYRNLFRALVPKGSQLLQSFLNDKDVKSKIFTTEEAGKTEFAIFFKVEPQTTAILKLKYRLPSSLNLKTLTHYSLNIQKQPGTVGEPFTFVFEEPFGKQLSGEGLQRENTSLKFIEDLKKDISLAVTIKEE